MTRHQVRHLPVIEDGHLIGIVSDRELSLLEAATLDDAHTPIVDAVSTNTFVVTADTSLEQVAEIMASQKFGSVVIVGPDGIEGIFTATDACRVLVAMLRETTLVVE